VSLVLLVDLPDPQQQVTPLPSPLSYTRNNHSSWYWVLVLMPENCLTWLVKVLIYPTSGSWDSFRWIKKAGMYRLR
ncbi:hypothetical protein, partial [Nitrosomonas eutropha]|uniref:hypothetical protein n=1 Tax=Nitrosomonas eutropha TaxID=916 RepID=UPI0021AD2222